MGKNTNVISINTEAWIPEIKKEISLWIEFSESVFCENHSDKQNALDHANSLKQFLEMVETNTLTQQQFEKYFYTYFLL